MGGEVYYATEKGAVQIRLIGDGANVIKRRVDHTHLGLAAADFSYRTFAIFVVRAEF